MARLFDADGRARCAYCGCAFDPPRPLRGTPRYCCRAHRQRAYERRQSDQRVADYERRNRRLRNDLTLLRHVLAKHGIADPTGGRLDEPNEHKVT
jgi:hypothetical protein